MFKHNIVHPMMWMLALLIGLSLWASAAMAQVYGNGSSDNNNTGAQGGDTSQTTDTVDTSNSGTGGTDDTNTTSGSGTGDTNAASSAAGLPSTGAGGLARANLIFLTTALFAAGAGAVLLRRAA
jgi:hypothetical protein